MILYSYLFLLFNTIAPLPEQLPDQYLVQQDFMTFDEPKGMFTPIYASLSIDNVPVTNTKDPEVAGLFTDATLAYLPLGTSIQKITDHSRREQWNYPIGTEVAHEIKFTDKPKTLFELRLLRKISDDQWDFASYSPALDSQKSLVRNRYTGLAPFRITFEAISGSKKTIDLKRINLKSCQNCHFVNSVASYQYEGPLNAGPCGFSPNNDNGIRGWIETFKSKYGRSPFSN